MTEKLDLNRALNYIVNHALREITVSRIMLHPEQHNPLPNFPFIHPGSPLDEEEWKHCEKCLQYFAESVALYKDNYGNRLSFPGVLGFLELFLGIDRSKISISWPDAYPSPVHSNFFKDIHIQSRPEFPSELRLILAKFSPMQKDVLSLEEAARRNRIVVELLENPFFYISLVKNLFIHLADGPLKKYGELLLLTKSKDWLYYSNHFHCDPNLFQGLLYPIIIPLIDKELRDPAVLLTRYFTPLSGGMLKNSICFAKREQTYDYWKHRWLTSPCASLNNSVYLVDLEYMKNDLKPVKLKDKKVKLETQHCPIDIHISFVLYNRTGKNHWKYEIKATNLKWMLASFYLRTFLNTEHLIYNWRDYCIGIESKIVYLKSWDGASYLHVPMFDYDGSGSLDKARADVKKFQKDFGLGHATLFKTKRGVHVYFFDSLLSKASEHKLLLETSQCCAGFKAFALNPKKTNCLRLSAKYINFDIEYLEDILNPDWPWPLRENTLSQIVKGIIDLGKKCRTHIASLNPNLTPFIQDTEDWPVKEEKDEEAIKSYNSLTTPDATIDLATIEETENQGEYSDGEEEPVEETDTIQENQLASPNYVFDIWAQQDYLLSLGANNLTATDLNNTANYISTINNTSSDS